MAKKAQEVEETPQTEVVHAPKRRENVPVHLSGRQFIHSGKLYFSEDGGPVMVHPDHADDILERMREMDEADGIVAEIDPTDVLAGATRAELLAEVKRLRANASDEAVKQAVDTLEEPPGGSGAKPDVVAIGGGQTPSIFSPPAV